MTKPVEHGLQLFFKKFKQKCWKGHHNYFCKSWCNFKALAQMFVCTHPRASCLTDHRAGQSVKTSDYYYIDPWSNQQVHNLFSLASESHPNLAHTWAGLVLVLVTGQGWWTESHERGTLGCHEQRGRCHDMSRDIGCSTPGPAHSQGWPVYSVHSSYMMHHTVTIIMEMSPQSGHWTHNTCPSLVSHVTCHSLHHPGARGQVSDIHKSRFPLFVSTGQLAFRSVSED